MQPDPIAPSEAVQMYLDERKPEVAKSTVYEHSCRLNRFLEWVEEQPDFDSMSEMTRKKAYEYRTYRAEEVAPSTLENEMRTFRLFLKTNERMGFVSEGIAKNFNVPTAPKSRRSRTVKLDPERAEAILDHLSEFNYASFDHILIYLMWHLGARIGGIRSLDLDDFHPEHPTGPYIEFVHRPEQGTPLKNNWRSEREPPLRQETTDLLLDYIEHTRHHVEDEHGREPLLTTKYGRPAKSTIQKKLYKMTRPCVIGRECPEQRDPDECIAMVSGSHAAKCPASRSPHALRRGRATANLNDGMPEEMVSDRMDMSPEILREHYNEQTEADKRKLQREFLDSL